MRALPLLLLLAACDVGPTAVTPDAAPLGPCASPAEVTLTSTAQTVRLGGSAALTASGGTGHYAYALSQNQSGATLSGARYLAGMTPGTDVVTVADECGQDAQVSIEVRAAFDVQPARATVKPGTRFVVRTQGFLGTPAFEARPSPLPSGGTLSAGGEYTAGATEGLDLVVVRDGHTGEEALLQFTVARDAALTASPGRLAVPTGTWAPLATTGGTGVLTWALRSGPGEVRDGRYVAPDAGSGTATLVAKDDFTGEEATVTVRLLTELLRPTRAQGRRTDVASLVTGDFDGDGQADLALGVPDADLLRPQGGAVFIFKGSPSGLPPEPTWTIRGDTDTAQLGAVLAAGDLDGDGRDDLAVSAPGADVTVTDSGAVFLYTFDAQGPRALRGPLTGAGRGNFGAALAIADLDGDGVNDLAVGSPGADLTGGAFSARGVVDVFLGARGRALPDFGSLRLGGVDLAPDAGLKATSNTRLGRGLVAADLNRDGRVDLAILTTVNATQLPGVPAARPQTAVAVHFGRDAGRPFEDAPDLFVLPTNPQDSSEGTWRLGVVPASGALPPLLVAAADQTDSPNLSADGGTPGGTNAGGALLYDLSAQHPQGAAANAPLQLGRPEAFARIYGDQSNITAGRSFTAADLDGDGQLELVLGAPYAAPTATVNGMSVSTPLGGKLLVYDLHALSPGAVVNKPVDFRGGAHRADTLGTAVTTWTVGGVTRVVAHNGRATTALGDFTGRLDAFAGAAPSAWTVTSADLPNAPAAEQFGAAVELTSVGGALRAVVGMPGYAGPASDGSGNEVGAGRAWGFSGTAWDAPLVLAEGAATPYASDAGVMALGGRAVGTDVTVTDFDGDGRADLAIAAPNFSPPTLLADGGSTNAEYAQLRLSCLPPSGQTPGGVLIHLGQADGTFKPGFRAWAPRDITACTTLDAGVAACQRSALGRAGLVGGFDFNGDGKQDLAVTRANGLEVFLGRAPDDVTLSKPSMLCDPAFTLPFIPQAVSAPAALGDVDGDGCAEVGLRYSDNNARIGVLIAFGFDASGTRCGGRTQASWVRLSGDAETGNLASRLGSAMTRAGRVLKGDARDFLAVGAENDVFEGQGQPVVLLLDVAQVAAKRPAQGGAVVGLRGDGLDPVPLLPPTRAPGFGRALAGGADVTGDGVADLVVSAPTASFNGDGAGAVYVFAGGAVVPGRNPPALVVAPDARERSAFGQDLAVTAKTASTPAALIIGAPTSYRTGTANGTAFVLPLDF